MEENNLPKNKTDHGEIELMERNDSEGQEVVETIESDSEDDEIRGLSLYLVRNSTGDVDIYEDDDVAAQLDHHLDPGPNLFGRAQRNTRNFETINEDEEQGLNPDSEELLTGQSNDAQDDMHNKNFVFDREEPLLEVQVDVTEESNIDEDESQQQLDRGILRSEGSQDANQLERESIDEEESGFLAQRTDNDE